MPKLERYEVEVRTTVSIITGGRAIAEFTVFGEAKGGSDEQTQTAMGAAADSALDMATSNASRLVEAVRANRRRELGYNDGY
jgi:hypothetical protein